MQTTDPMSYSKMMPIIVKEKGDIKFEYNEINFKYLKEKEDGESTALQMH